MKKTILTVTIVIAGIFASAVLISSCSGKKEHDTEEHHHEEGDTTAHHDEMEMDSTKMAYACPMHPEVTGKEGDSCSKCGMKMVAVNADSTKMHGGHEH